MAFLHDDILDDGLQVLTDDANALHICSQEPATYAEATTTYTLGNKTSPAIAAPSDRAGGGREVVVSAISDGEVTGTGTATHWAIVKTTATEELLATGALNASQAVTDGNTFTLTQFAIGIPDPA